MNEENWRLLVDAAETVPSLLMTGDITVKIGGILWADAELTRLREERSEAVKIIMAVVGNGLLKDPVFTALEKRAREFYERTWGKEWI